MKFTDFPESNFTFTRPEDMPEEDCGDLKVFRGVDEKGYPIIISHWKPTPEEIEDIKNGKGIYLNIYGKGMPPVSLQTAYPFVKQDDVKNTDN